MKILLAGGAGYIGSALAPVLLKRGFEVDVIDLLWFGNNLPQGISVCKKDLFDCTVKDFEGYDHVIFLAGISNDPMAELSPSKNFIYNAALPSYLAFLSKKAGVRRFIYASSCSVYGYTPENASDEDAVISCHYPYGISKLQGERGVHQLQDKNFSVISLRQGTVSGHSSRMRLDLFINTMFKTAHSERKITVNNPSIWRPFYDIVDTVQAFLCAINADHELSGVFNVASANYQIIDAANIIKDKYAELTGKDVFLDVRDILDYRNYKVSTKKAESVLGFSPMGSIERVITELYECWPLYGDYNNSRYYNINIFSEMESRLSMPLF